MVSGDAGWNSSSPSRYSYPRYLAAACVLANTARCFGSLAAVPGSVKSPIRTMVVRAPLPSMSASRSGDQIFDRVPAFLLSVLWPLRCMFNVQITTDTCLQNRPVYNHHPVLGHFKPHKPNLPTTREPIDTSNTNQPPNKTSAPIPPTITITMPITIVHESLPCKSLPRPLPTYHTPKSYHPDTPI